MAKALFGLRAVDHGCYSCLEQVGGLVVHRVVAPDHDNLVSNLRCLTFAYLVMLLYMVHYRVRRASLANSNSSIDHIIDGQPY